MTFVLVIVLLNIKYLDLKSYRSMGLDSITLGKVMAAGRESWWEQKTDWSHFHLCMESKEGERKQKVGNARHPQSPPHCYNFFHQVSSS